MSLTSLEDGLQNQHEHNSVSLKAAYWTFKSSLEFNYQNVKMYSQSRHQSPTVHVTIKMMFTEILLHQLQISTFLSPSAALDPFPITIKYWLIFTFLLTRADKQLEICTEINLQDSSTHKCLFCWSEAGKSVLLNTRPSEEWDHRWGPQFHPDEGTIHSMFSNGLKILDKGNHRDVCVRVLQMLHADIQSGETVFTTLLCNGRHTLLTLLLVQLSHPTFGCTIFDWKCASWWMINTRFLFTFFFLLTWRRRSLVSFKCLDHLQHKIL